jgi:co-chaperonin GroES (HSP10)
MSGIGVHDFAIPHEHVQPARDMIVIRLPLPPKMIGSMILPDLVRDMAQHNVMAGRIVKMGPMAFQYKDGNGIATQSAKVGDWVVIRPFAGTLMQGGKLQVTNGWRYVSSFQDVLAVVPAEHMPASETLLWDEDESQQKTEGAAVVAKPVAEFNFDNKKAV